MDHFFRGFLGGSITELVEGLLDFVGEAGPPLPSAEGFVPNVDGETVLEVGSGEAGVRPNDADVLSPSKRIAASSIILTFPTADVPFALFPTCSLVSSRNGHASQGRVEPGSARDTRRCCFNDWGEVGVLRLADGTKGCDADAG